MDNLIQLNLPEIETTLDTLLLDRTTNKNIIWFTNSYIEYGDKYNEQSEITKAALKNLNENDIQPRVLKTKEIQKNRTKKRAEVFTPSWICNIMNNHCDEQWFGRPDVFNIPLDNHNWEERNEIIIFPNQEGKGWKEYILSTRLEITCGEAPYLVSRYDTTTGELIKVSKRIGMLDRKLRIINENTNTEEEWLEWVIKAYQSTYGYEFQGDNLLIARINLLLTFVDYYKHRWNKEPKKEQLIEIAAIISWNVFQMDGLVYTIPFTDVYTKIMDWNKDIIIYFKDLGKD